MSFTSASAFLIALVAFIASGAGQNFTTVISDSFVFEISDFELPWADAIDSCASRNSSLLTIESAEKDRHLVDLFLNNGTDVIALPGNSWIAATEYSEGVWIWKTTNEPTYYTRWFVGQPDDTENLNCAYMAVGALFYWRDANCSAPMYFLCAKSVM